MRSRNRLPVFLSAALLLALTVVGATAGVASVLDLLLFAAPFLVVAALLLNGWFIGEDRILAARRSLPKSRRRTAQRWAGRPELPFTSALERAPWSLRGPPAGLSLA